MKLTTLQQIENKFLAGETEMDLFVEYTDMIDRFTVNIRELLTNLAVGEDTFSTCGEYRVYGLGKTDKGIGKDDLMEGNNCNNVYAQYSEAEEFVIDEILEMNDYEISIDEAREILNRQGG